MSKSNNTMLYIGGAAVLGYLLLNKSGVSLLPGASTNPGTTPVNVVPGANVQPTSNPNVVQAFGTYLLKTAPQPPGPWPVYTQAGTGWQTPSTVKTWYLTYELPAHKLMNPNVANSGYTLTPAEAQQYLSNYADVLQSLQTAAQSDKNDPTRYHGGGSLTDAAIWHWHTWGVSDQRTFLPMYPQYTDTFNPTVPPVTASSGGGNSWITTGLQVAGGIIALLGPNDAQLNDTEVKTLVCAAPVLKDILPYYYKTDRKLAMAIEARLDGLLSQYIK